MKLHLFLIIILAINTVCKPQHEISISHLKSLYATETRQLALKKTQENNINEIFGKELNSGNVSAWITLYNDVSLTLKKSAVVEKGIRSGLLNFQKFPHKFSRSVLEAAYTLYPNDFVSEVKSILKETKDPTTFSIAAIYLLRIDTVMFQDEIMNKVGELLSSSNDPILISFKNFVNTLSGEFEPQLPPLIDILRNNFVENTTVMYSFQRKDRNYPGITIIRSPGGKFLRDEEGSVFSVPQLARSVSNLPGFLKNGNTPQGIYTIEGWYITPTESIGPTPIVLTRTPFEVSPDKFFHGKNSNSRWTLEDYDSIVPKSWMNYSPIFESFYAGKSGRKLIVMHGSADDLSYYSNEPYYPLTPTRGCLSTKEIWDESTGKCLESDQVKLINAFLSTGNQKGFLVVLELDNKKSPVTLEEILPFVLEAEKQGLYPK